MVVFSGSESIGDLDEPGARLVGQSTLELQLRHEAIGRFGTAFPRVAHADAHALRRPVLTARVHGYGHRRAGAEPGI